MHRRRIEARGGGVWEIHDRFEGGGAHRFVLRLQLAPGAEVEAGAAGAGAHWPDGGSLTVRIAAAPPGAVVRIEDGEVSPGWNRRETAPRFALSWTAEVPCECRLLLETMP